MNKLILSEEHKGYNITTCEIPCMRKIKTIGKGSVPNALLGLYTSAGAARKSIDLYLASKG